MSFDTQHAVLATRTILASSERPSRQCRWLLRYLLGREGNTLGDALLAIESRPVKEFGPYMAAMAATCDEHLSDDIRSGFGKVLRLPVGKQLLMLIEVRNLLEAWAMAMPSGETETNSMAALRGNLRTYFLPQQWTNARKPTPREACEFACHLYNNSPIKDGHFIRALSWHLPAASAGYARAEASMGWYFDECGDSRLYVMWTRKGAEHGNAVALFNLGLIYRDGRNGIRQDYKKALRYFLKAEKRGYSRARAGLGGYYIAIGDYTRAKEWLMHALQVNPADVDALCFLGWMHEEGWGMPSEPHRALEYYEKAASLGDENAQQYILELQPKL